MAHYRSAGWEGLRPCERAQLLLVMEGVKRGTVIGGDHAAISDILSGSGLEAKVLSESYLLHPTYRIAHPETLLEYHRRHLTRPSDPAGINRHRIEGWFFSYPPCCTEEYVRPPPAERTGPRYRNHPFGRELEQLIFAEGSYPEILDYRPPSFTPCSVRCEKAVSLLAIWKEALDYHDPEAAQALRAYNRLGSPSRYAHQEFFKAHGKELMEKHRMLCLRGSCGAGG